MDVSWKGKAPSESALELLNLEPLKPPHAARKRGEALTFLQNSNTLNFDESLFSDKYFVELF